MIPLLAGILLTSPSFSQTLIGGTINTYWPVTSVDFCNNRVALPSIAAGINIGDKVLLMQMEGTTIDTSDASVYGSVTAYNNAGHYELLTVASISNNLITFMEAMLNHYDAAGKVQLVLVPQYTDVTVSSTLTAPAWNESTGGVIAFIASGTVTLNADIDASGLGFQGALVTHDGACYGGGTGYGGYRCTLTDEGGALKGNGTAGLLYQNYGQGAPANGGGGGNDSNTGGGGGGNGAAGGQGGMRVNVTSGCNGDYAGNGGYALNYSNAENRIYLGGGGGAGDDNSNGATAGGNGGGIIILQAANVAGNNFSILARGADASATPAFMDGAGGGGGGGTILLDAATISDVTMSVNGGLGGSIDNGTAGADSCFGPGGGGGAGMIWVSGSTLPPVTLESAGGSSGTTSGSACNGSTNGALAGNNSTPLTSLVIPESTILFVPLSLTVSNDTIVCVNTAAFLSCSADGTGNLSYSWDNGDTTASTTVYPSALTTYQITVTDERGCSITKTIDVDVKTTTVTASAYPDSIVKGWEPVFLLADTAGNASFTWTPSDYLNNSTIYNPVANPVDTTIYCVTAIGTNGCIDTACVTVYVLIPPPALLIPNAFTPNGDGLNDFWHIITNNECYTIDDIKVWNRWGMEVYDYIAAGKIDWAGDYAGTPQAIEVYYYYIKAHCDENLDATGKPKEESYTGNVTVIR